MRLSIPEHGIIPTGNEFLALPSIRAANGAIDSFNTLSMARKGLLEAAGKGGAPLLTPFATVNGKPLAFKNLSWDLAGWWIPKATLKAGGLELSLTYCAPSQARGAMFLFQAKNLSSKPLKLKVGFKRSWSGLNRVIYASSKIAGTRLATKAPWVADGLVFSQRTDDTIFSWCLLCRGGKHSGGAESGAVWKELALGPQAKAEAGVFLGVAPEEFSASNSAKVIADRADREGAQGLVDGFAKWCEARGRKTRTGEFDTLMNRNFLFNRFYAWGRTLDTEELCGVTSRSPRYYVCAAYWDRDAMLWSFPALLDSDPDFAREALDCALGRQLNNTGRHSRFIDGTVLEDGYQLDEGAAPIIAARDYFKKSGDRAWLKSKAPSLAVLEGKLLSRYEPSNGLFNTQEDSQDEYVKERIFTYANSQVWVALGALADIHKGLGNGAKARQFGAMRGRLRKAVLKYCVASPGKGKKPIFCRVTDLQNHKFEDVPPGSLLRMAPLGFVPESHPVFQATCAWLESKDHKWHQSGPPYGLPTSWRLPFTSLWSVVDQLRLKRGHARALRILRKATWDFGIISEGIDTRTAEGLGGGSAFAAAGGYMSHALYEVFGKK